MGKLIPPEWRDVYRVEGAPLMMPEDYLEPPELVEEVPVEVVNGKWVMQAAARRGLILGIVAALIVAVVLWFFVALLVAALVAVAIGVVVLVIRCIEGIGDAERASKNDVRRHDVGAFSNPIHAGQQVDR